MKDDIGDRAQIDLVACRGQLQVPGTDRARTLERQVAGVAEVVVQGGQKQARVVLAGGSKTRFVNNVVVESRFGVGGSADIWSMCLITKNPQLTTFYLRK
jgi:hypothetical protein